MFTAGGFKAGSAQLRLQKRRGSHTTSRDRRDGGDSGIDVEQDGIARAHNAATLAYPANGSDAQQKGGGGCIDGGDNDDDGCCGCGGGRGGGVA